MSDDLKRNAEGYPDPTAYFAIKNADKEYDDQLICSDLRNLGVTAEDSARFHDLLESIFSICERSGFHLEDRIVVKDKRTGKIWR